MNVNGDGDTGANGGVDPDNGVDKAITGPLESRYRRILMLLPAAYRERRGEEMLGTLLDTAAEGKRWPSAREAASLAALALRLRVGAPGGTRRSVAAGEVLRRTALAGLLGLGLWSGGLRVGNLIGLTFQRGFDFRYFPKSTLAWILVMDLFVPLVYFGAFTALVLGRRRLGRFLGVAQAGFVAFTVAEERYAATSDRAALLAAVLVIATASGFGFHREAPRPQAPGRWLTAMVGMTGFVFIVFGLASAVRFAPHSGGERLLGTIVAVTGGPLVPGLAAVFGVVRARRSPIWPAALLLLGLPGLLLVPRAIVFHMHGTFSEYLNLGGLSTPTWPGTAIDMLIADAILAAALVWSLYRHRVRSRAIAA